MKLTPIGSNQNMITTSKGDQILFSYQTPVAAYLADTGDYVRTQVNWSRTTTRHINSWLQGVTAETVPQGHLDALAQ